MEAMMHGQQPQVQPQPQPVERLNLAVQQQLNLEAVKTRAISLFKAISRILEDFDAYARTNTTPKWQDILGQYSMVNLELFNIVEEIKKVSKAFVVHPKNVNAENAAILPVMLSSKLFPEMEMDDNSKREQLLQGMQNLPIATQIEKLKARIDIIGVACETAEKVLADIRKAYGFGTRQGPALGTTLDKGQAAKIQEQETLLRAAVNFGEGLRLPGDRQITPVLPMHLVDVLNISDGGPFSDTSGMYLKNTPVSSNNMGGQNTALQASGSQLMGRSAASPSAATNTPSFDNVTTSPLPYANSPRSSTNIMNTHSPQQQTAQQQQQQQQQQQRQKLMQLPQHQQQVLAQQQFRQSAIQGSQLSQMHDLQGQAQQKFQSLHGQHPMQFSQQIGHQQFQGRQLSSGHIQHSMGTQLNQGNPINRLSQFPNPSNNALFNTGQTTQNAQMLPNISASQALLPRMQFGMSGNNPQRSHPPQILSDQMFNMGAGNAGSMMPVQQQQQLAPQGAFGSMPSNAQTLQSGMAAVQNTQQNHSNFPQQRQQNP